MLPHFIFLKWLTCLFIHQPVDRILQQKAEREAAEKAKAKAGASLISNEPEMVPEGQMEIPSTQLKIPSSDTATQAPAPQTTPGNTGSEHTSQRSYGLGLWNHSDVSSDASSSWPTSPLESEDMPVPPPSNPVPPPPNPNVPERGCSPPRPGPPRDPITPLSDIGTSL